MKPSSSSTPKQNQAPGQSTSSTTPAGSTPLSQQQRPGNTVTTSPPQQLNPATSFQPSWTKVASRNQSTLPPKGGEAQESQVVPQSTGALSSVPQITIIPDKEEAVVSSDVFRRWCNPIMAAWFYELSNVYQFTKSFMVFSWTHSVIWLAHWFCLVPTMDWCFGQCCCSAVEFSDYCYYYYCY